MLPLLRMYETVVACQIRFRFCYGRTECRDSLTLVVDDAHGEERQEQSPGTGRGDGVNDIVDLGRETGSRELGGSQHGAKGGRGVDRGSHCVDGRR